MRFIFSALAVLFLFATAAPAQSSSFSSNRLQAQSPSLSQTAQKFLKDGDRRFQEGDYHGAVIQYDNAVREAPADMSLRLKLGTALMYLEDYPRAGKMLMAVINQQPNDQAYLTMTRVLYAQGRLPEAKLYLAKAGPGASKQAFSTLIEAALRLEQNDPQEARKLVLQIKDEAPVRDLAPLLMARIYDAEGNLASAYQALEGLSAGQSRSFQATLLKARIALRSGDLARSVAIAKTLDVRDPGNVSAGSILVEAYLGLGDTDAVQTVLTKLNPISDDDPRPRYLTMLYYLSQNRTEEAALIGAEISDWLLMSSQGAVLAARLKLAQKAPMQAEALLKEYLSKHGDDAEVTIMLASLMVEGGRQASAVRLIGKALAKNPDDAALLSMKAQLLLDQGQTDEAAQLLQSLAGKGDLFAASLSSMASLPTGKNRLLSVMTKLEAGKEQEAEELLEKVLADEPDNVLALNLQAGISSRNGNTREAKAFLQKALTIAPDYSAAALNLARLEARRVEDPEQRLAILTASLEQSFNLNPESYLLNAALVGLYEKQGRSAEQEKLLIQSHRAYPADASIARRLAVHYQQQQQWAPALSVLHTAYDAGSRDPRLLISLIRAFEREGDKEQAFKTARTEIEQTTNAQMDQLFVEIGFETGKAEEVAAVIARLERSSPERGALLRSHYLRAKEGDAAAANYLLDFVSKAPGSSLMIATYKAGRKAGGVEEKKAWQALNDWVQTHPEDGKACKLVGDVLLSQGKLVEAEKMLTRALSADPRNPALLNNLAYVRMRLDLVGAAALAAQAVALAPEEADFLDTYGQILLAEKDPRAIAILEEAAAIAPARADIADTLKRARRAFVKDTNPASGSLKGQLRLR